LTNSVAEVQHSAAGTGNTAIRAAEAGAHNVELEWVEADAEAALPFADGEFDVVASSFGAILPPTTTRSRMRCCVCAGPVARSGSSPSPLRA
jgi:hypothetical protein